MAETKKQEKEIKQEKEPKQEKEIKKEDFTVQDLPGVGAATAEKLSECGYDNLMAIAVATPGEIIASVGVTEVAARKMIKAARDMLEMGFESGAELLKKRKKVIKITSGSKALDTLLGGGFETGVITETYGAYGSGKCVSKDTPVLYFNDALPHINNIEEAYEKYKRLHGEKKFDNGFLVPLKEVKVLGLNKNKLKKTKAQYIYKEQVNKIFEIHTKRGRTLKITAPHRLLSFDNGFVWKPAVSLCKGDLLAYPKILAFSGTSKLSSEDAYFFGLFVAEGTSNPLSITTGSKKLAKWLIGYIEKNFKYKPTVRADKGKPHIILLRKPTKEFLGNLANCSAGTKFVPEKILSADDEVAKSFLAGYFDGDAYIPRQALEFSTKSKVLARDMSYLLLKLGISTTKKDSYVKGNRYYRLFIVGEDRVKLNTLPLKIKKAEYKARNSAYGYGGPIIDYLKKSYKQSLGGNRGSKRKILGKRNHSSDIFYKYLASGTKHRQMNEKTIQKILLSFKEGLKRVDRAINLTDNLEKHLLEIYDLLPFAFNKLAKDMDLTKSGIRNYVDRGVPNKERAAQLKSALLRELNKRKEHLLSTILILKETRDFNWDIIDRVKEIPYNDYVYDFVVPETHNFIGGNMPAVMHNTQIGHLLTVNAQLPKDKGGAGGSAVFIDTEGTFRPERIIEFAKGAGLDPEKVLKNVHVARAYNSDHQMLLAERIEELIKKGLNIKIVIVDSLTAHFRAEFIGRGSLAERQQKLNKHMHTLAKLADVHNLSVYVTNQVMAKPDMFFGDPTEAIGGHIVSHNSVFRIYLRRGKKGSRVAKLIDSPSLPDGETMFFVETDGLRDVKDAKEPK